MTDRPHVNLRDLEANAYVEGTYCLVNPQLGASRSGKKHLKCLLRDATGEVSARHWSFDEREIDNVGATGFARISGHTQVYNGQIQLNLEQIRAAEVGDDELRQLLPTSSRDLDEMLARVRAILATLAHPAMRSLADAYLEDERLVERFKRAPAATTLHHAWIGGLLEHTLQLLELADGMLRHYEGLNRDLVLMGLFLHDIAKVWELSWERGFEYTADGNLIGHVVRGAIVLQVKAAEARRRGAAVPPDALRVLQHIVLSHHGQLDHGAAKVPSTPEAIFVAMLDNLDARTEMALKAVDRGRAGVGGDFTERVWALDTRLYRPDPLAVATE